MAGKASALVGSAVFLALAPGMVGALIPWVLTRWRTGPAFFGIPFLPGVGGACIVLGAAGLLECFGRFALQGRGTPAPPFPTQKLVVTGLYRWTRNPMYVAVLLAIVGQGLLFGSVALLIYAAAAWIVTACFVRFYEEPALRRSYGPEYLRYCQNVPRWIPRLRPWRGD